MPARALISAGVAVAVGLIVTLALSGTAGNENELAGEDPSSNTTQPFGARFFPVHRVGDCLVVDELPSGELTQAKVSCEDVHTGEVYIAERLTDPIGAPRPDEELLIGQADRLCVEGFEHYVGAPYLDSSLDFLALIPTTVSWRRANDRHIFCLAVDTDGDDLTESVRASAR